MSTKRTSVLSKNEERKVLATQSKEMRKNPSHGVKMAQEAGILKKDGQLANYYKRKA